MNIPTCPFSEKDINAIIDNLLKNIATSSNCLTMSNNNVTILSKPGAVIASPAMPDNHFSQSYFFHWVRDGAIVISTICTLYENCSDPQRKAYYKEIILSYVDFVEKIQSQPMLNNVNVLGEPKFNVDGTVWTQPWGRPQAGGAACQALVLAKIYKILNEEGGHNDILKKIYSHEPTSLLKANLEYCTQVWSEPSFNMWEELNGKHFSVNFMQYIALCVGTLVAAHDIDPKAALYYRTIAHHMIGVIRSHWSEDLGYYFETLNAENMLGGGIDSSILITLCNVQDYRHLDEEFYITSYRSLSTIFYIRNAFENLYKINVNNKMQGIKGVLIGRYTQDIYDGNQSVHGNPWFLCSAMLATTYYLIAIELLKGEKILVNNLTMQFLTQTTSLTFVLDDIIDENHPHFSALLESFLKEGDAILALLKQYSATYPDGSTMHMSEQIDRVSGEQISARDLSWSYAELLHTLHERENLVNLLKNKFGK